MHVNTFTHTRATNASLLPVVPSVGHPLVPGVRLRSQRLLDGGQIHTLYCSHTLAVFEHKKHGLDAALIFLEEWDFIKRSCREFQIFILEAHLPQRRLDALARPAPCSVRLDNHALQGRERSGVGVGGMQHPT